MAYSIRIIALSALTLLVHFASFAGKVNSSEKIPVVYLSRQFAPADGQLSICKIDFENELVGIDKYQNRELISTESKKMSEVFPSKVAFHDWDKNAVSTAPLNQRMRDELFTLLSESLQEERPKAAAPYDKADSPIFNYPSYTMLDSYGHGGHVVRDLWMIHSNHFQKKLKNCRTQKMVELMDQACDRIEKIDVWKTQQRHRPRGLCEETDQ